MSDDKHPDAVRDERQRCLRLAKDCYLLSRREDTAASILCEIRQLCDDIASGKRYLPLTGEDSA